LSDHGFRACARKWDRYAGRQMKPILRFLLLASCAWVVAISVRAQMIWQAPSNGYGGNYASEFSTTFGSAMKEYGGVSGDISTLQARAGFTGQWSPNEKLAISAGVGWDYYGIDKPAGVPLPAAVDGLALRLGAHYRFTDKWSIRLELRPGLYSDFVDISWEDFNLPATIALAYQFNTNLLAVLGVSVNFRSDLATIGGPGVWWRFARDWALNLILPNPSLDYYLNRQITLFAGGEIKAGGYRVAEDFGRKNGVPELDNDIFSYREIRVGAGLRYRIHRAMQLRIAGGYTVDRRFEYRTADLELRTEDAPYVEASLSGSF
jgi:hypothetical protein